MSNLVHHIISAGLERGRYYKVYVTQVNTAGLESERSEPSYVRVGDVTGPPTPVLSIDTSYGANGFLSNNGFVDVGIKWTTPECDDLWQYYIYTTKHFSGYKGDGVYTKTESVANGYQKALTSATNSYVLPKQDQDYLYIGIQAMDYSHNLSDIYVIKVLAEDKSVVPYPNNPIHVERGGIWSLRVWTECPMSSQVAQVIFYRDGWKQLAPVPFVPGMIAEITDVLEAIDGLSHWYTYRYMDKNGHLSAMSKPSETVTASAIELEYINSVALDALKSAWRTEAVDDIEALKASLLTQAQTTQDLAKQLATVTENYNQIYDQYTLLAKQVQILSASAEESENKLTAMQTSITQNSQKIELRALKTYVDQEAGQVLSASVAAIEVQSDRITQVVSELGKATSTITTLAGQIQLKVSQGDVQAAIDMAVQNGLSVAQITADRIVLNGQLLINNNARVVGRLYADNLALINQDGSIAWGSGAGELHPVVTDLFDSEQIISSASSFNGWEYHLDKSFTFTPHPRVAFNGVCSTSINATVKFVFVVPQNYFAIHNYDRSISYDYSSLDSYNLQFLIWTNIEGNPNQNWELTDSRGTSNVSFKDMEKQVNGPADPFNYPSVAFYGSININRTFVLPIGTQQTFSLWFRTRTLSNGEHFYSLPGKVVFYDRNYHIECL